MSAAEIQQGWKVKVKGEKHRIFLAVEIADGQAELIYHKRNAWEKDESRFAPVADLTRVCAEIVHEPGRGFHHHLCGRPSKYPSGLCGVHGGAVARAAAQDAERAATKAREAQKIAEAEARLRALGVKGTVGTTSPRTGPNQFISHFSGSVRVTLDELERALAQAFEEGRRDG